MALCKLGITFSSNIINNRNKNKKQLFGIHPSEECSNIPKHILFFQMNNKTCGEIICQSRNKYFITCKLCDLNILDYAKFIEHFDSKHLAEVAADHGQSNPKVYEELEEEHISAAEYSRGSEEDALSLNRDTDFNEHEVELKQEKNILKKKLEVGTFECTQCQRKFSTKFYLRFHERQQHAPKTFKCDKCEKSFVEERYLKLHQKSHSGYTCKTCNKSFVKYESLRYHEEGHIESRDFICDYGTCAKGFPNKRRLSAHKRSHFAQALYVCEICGSRQRSKEFLTVHIRTHTGEKPYACKLCDRRFASKHFLADHQAVHQTDRPHVCDVCDKAFASRKSLYHHRHLHSGVKKFVCKICGNAFSQAAGLSAHMRKHKLMSGICERPAS